MTRKRFSRYNSGMTAENQFTISGGFWRDRLEVNARRAIFHQWEQLEASGCIENFRIASGDADGLREGWFFADSDAYKWLDAASRIFASYPDPQLAARMNNFISLAARAQRPDGYLFTYNQIHFPAARWVNLQIEHELYCHGHLIEAGVSHFENTSQTTMLEIARRAADRIVADFRGKGADHTPGHEEIEIALLRLHHATHHKPYLEMARQFIEQRGYNPFFALSIARQNVSVGKRGEYVKQKKQEYLSAHPEYKPFQLPPGNFSKQPRDSMLRWYASALTGKYFQQHAPVREQTIPVGHSVRFGYLETAIAMLSRETGDATFIPALQQAWERMVTRRMYVTGGIGALPGLEGFGNDYELDPEIAYAETCAALASMFWNWEMAQITKEAKYSDLFEWQLYNAAAAGMGSNGENYLYNNPLVCRGGVTRQFWYAVPCCPSNLSRTWADLGKYVCSSGENELYIHQYISGKLTNEIARVEIQSDLPWNHHVRMAVNPNVHAADFTLNLRSPSWADHVSVFVNGALEISQENKLTNDSGSAASGYDPRQSQWISVRRVWSAGDVVEVKFDASVLPRRAHPKVKPCRGKVAVSYGPLIYCLESVDHPNVNIFDARLDASSLEIEFDSKLLGGVVKIRGKTKSGEPLTFIPYHLWGNRGASTMTVYVNE